MTDILPASGTTRRTLVTLHRWLGLAAAAIWLVQAVTGILLVFHFEAEDAMLSTRHVSTDPAAIERRIDMLAGAGGKAKVDWIWTTAGLSDRYIILHDDSAGVSRKAYIDGAGTMLRNAPADDYSFLGLVREIHLTLVAGTAGHWILAISGVLLLTNLIFGLIVAWPKRGQWRHALRPRGRRGSAAGYYSWHKALGLWAGIPALIIIASGTLVMFEEQVRDLVGAEGMVVPTKRLPGIAATAARDAAATPTTWPGARLAGRLTSSAPTRSRTCSSNITSVPDAMMILSLIHI